MKTRRMAIANRTYVSFCNQPKAHFGLPWVLRPWDNQGKCYMDGKRIQCLLNTSQHISIYIQPFTIYSEILVGNCNFLVFFLPPCIERPCWGCSHWNPGKKFGPQKTRIMGLPGREDSLTIGWAVSTQYQCVTDRRKDRRPAYINNVHSMTVAP